MNWNDYFQWRDDELERLFLELFYYKTCKEAERRFDQAIIDFRRALKAFKNIKVEVR